MRAPPELRVRQGTGPVQGEDESPWQPASRHGGGARTGAPEIEGRGQVSLATRIGVEGRGGARQGRRGLGWRGQNEAGPSLLGNPAQGMGAGLGRDQTEHFLGGRGAGPARGWRNPGFPAPNLQKTRVWVILSAVGPADPLSLGLGARARSLPCLCTSCAPSGCSGPQTPTGISASSGFAF